MRPSANSMQLVWPSSVLRATVVQWLNTLFEVVHDLSESVVLCDIHLTNPRDEPAFLDTLFIRWASRIYLADLDGCLVGKLKADWSLQKFDLLQGVGFVGTSPELQGKRPERK